MIGLARREHPPSRTAQHADHPDGEKRQTREVSAAELLAEDEARNEGDHDGASSGIGATGGVRRRPLPLRCGATARRTAVHRPSLPALRSRNAAAISSSVFITKGPRETIGSPIGTPSIQRMRVFPAAWSECMPRSR